MAPFVDGFDPRGVAIGSLFIGVAEMFVGLRHRISLKCARCGFDPIIYRKSHEQAASLVREHIARRGLNPANLLAEPVIAAGRRASHGEELKAAREKAQLREKARRRQVDSPQQP